MRRSIDSDGLEACQFLGGGAAVRAYLFHQPDLVRALVAASEGRVRVRLVCDLSQAKGKTRLQRVS